MDKMFSRKAGVNLASFTNLSIKKINTEESSTSSSQFPYNDSDTEKENNPEKSM